MIIDNWGYNCENESAKGYLMIAVKKWNRESPCEKIDEETLKNLLTALGWAFSDCTAQEAFDYYMNH